MSGHFVAVYALPSCHVTIDSIGSQNEVIVVNDRCPRYNVE